MLVEVSLFRSGRPIQINTRHVVSVEPPEFDAHDENQPDDQSVLYTDIELSTGRSIRVAGASSQITALLNRSGV